MSEPEIPYTFGDLGTPGGPPVPIPASQLDANNTYLLTLIKGLIQSLTITGTPPSTGTVGTAYSFMPAASGGVAPLVFSQSGALPPGINFDAGTGALSGVPEVAGSYSDLGISVTDWLGNSAQLAVDPFTITISSGGGGNPDFFFPGGTNLADVAATF